MAFFASVLPRGLTWAVALVAALLLGACQPANHPIGPTGANQATPTTARDPALWRELERIERQARARPREQELALQALQARTAPGSAERLELLSLRGLMAGYLHDRALIDELLGQLRHWPLEAGKPSAELAAAVMLSHFYQNKGDLREALKALAPLEQERGKTRAPLLLLRAQAALAYVQADRGQMEEALAAALQAVKLAEGTGSHWRRALTLNELARVYHRTQQVERAKQINAEAWTEALLDPDPMLLNALANMRGIAHAADADSSVTLQAWSQALKYAREAGAEGPQALALANYADHYLRRGEFQRALALSEQALPLARRAQNLNAEIVALHNLGIAKIGLKQIDEGQRYVRQGIALDEQQGALSYAADGWKELGQYLERAGAWSGAIEAHHQYRRLIDQVLRDETRKTVLEAQERYDDERRAKEIELLNRDNSLKAEQIRTHDLELKLSAALAGCIVLSATLLGLAYRRIRRTNQALARSNEHLKIQSERDPLTGLANRRHFQSAIKRLAEAGKLAGTVYLIDIDHFKRINDQWGHAAGDSVLINVAQRLRGALREDDLVVRWGGEEFLIVVPPRAAADAQQLAQRLLDLIATPAVPHGARPIAVSASIGFASFPLAPHGLTLSWERAIDLVDTVMYMAKAHGRNKAYGVLQIDARDEAGLIELSTRMEAAWQAGQVELVAMQGPQEGPA